MDTVDAFVLHARPYRESSQLVDLLTREQGRTGVLVRGSRGAKRTNAMQPFRCYRLVLSGRGELRRGQQAESTEPPRFLAGDALFAALYMNELLMRLLFRDVPVPNIFPLYARTLDALLPSANAGVGGETLETCLRSFEKALLDDLGYGHRYGETVAGLPVEPDAFYSFDPDAGIREVMAPGVGEQQRCYRGSTLLAIDSGTLRDMQSLREAKHLMRAALAPHLGDKPLNSRALFRPVRAMQDPETGENA